MESFAVTGSAVLVILGVSLVAPGMRLMFSGAALALLLSVYAMRRPLRVLGIGLVLVAVVPQYAAPYLPGTFIGATPALVLSLVLLPAAYTHRHLVRPVPLDVAVAAFCLLRVLSYVFNVSQGFGSALGFAVYVPLLYVVARVVLAIRGATRVASISVVVGGAVCSLLALSEHLGTPNLLFDLPGSGYQFAQFARPEVRFAEVRAEASFGHPIALGMFLALAIVLAMGLALESRSGWARLALLGSGALMVEAITFTLSRGPLLMLAVSMLLFIVVEARRIKVVGLLALGVVAFGVLSVGPVSSTVQTLVATSSGDTPEAQSAEYRLAILDVIRDPGQFSLLGRPTVVESGGVTQTVSLSTGLGRSLDNGFAVIYLTHGVLTAVAFVAIGCLAFISLGQPGARPVERAWVVVLVAAFLNLVTVNLLTQFEDFYWLAVALAACAWQAGRAGAVHVGEAAEGADNDHTGSELSSA